MARTTEPILRGRTWEQKEPPQQTLVSTDFSLHAESESNSTAQTASVYILTVTSHTDRQQCLAMTGESLGKEGGGQERRMQGTQGSLVELQHSLADTSAPNETTLHTFVSSCGVPCINIQTSHVLDLVLERYAQRSQLLNNMQLLLSQGQLQHMILHTVP